MSTKFSVKNRRSFFSTIIAKETPTLPPPLSFFYIKFVIQPYLFFIFYIKKGTQFFVSVGSSSPFSFFFFFFTSLGDISTFNSTFTSNKQLNRQNIETTKNLPNNQLQQHQDLFFYLN